MKNVLKVTFAYIAAVIGAGFASGSEAVLYFVRYGKVSFFGVLLTGVGLGFFSYIILSACKKYNTYSFDELAEIVCGRRLAKVITAFLYVFMLIMLAAMISGCAEMMFGAFGISMTFTSVAFSCLCFFILLMPAEKIIKWCGVAGGFIVVFIIFCCVYMINFRSRNVFSNLGNSLTSAVFYTSYNFFAVCPLLCSAAKDVKDEKECRRVGVLSFLFSFGALFLIWCLIMVYYNKISLGTMPMLTLAKRQGMWFSVLYALVIFVSVLSSAIANAYGIYLKYEGRKTKGITVLLILLAGWVLSSVGFTNIVGKLYGGVGVVSSLFPLTIFVKKMKNGDISRKIE